jgi:two-component system NarL family response regulator
MTKIRVLIVDDHPVVRQGLITMMKSMKDIEVVGQAGDGQEALELVGQLEPDVILLDIRMPGPSGLQIIDRLRTIRPEVKIIVLTSYDAEEHLFGALRAGAHGFLLKSIAHEKLGEAIRAVWSGERQLSPDVVGRVMEEFEVLSQQLTKREYSLSKSEIQILRLIADGYTNKEIAQKQHWSEVTVKRRISSILTKLKVTSRAQAVAEAVKKGLI